MSTESIMLRLRRANPVPRAGGGGDADLFAEITALPGDPRLAAAPGQRLLRRRRAVVFALALGLAVLVASTALAVSHWIGDDIVEPPVTRQEYLDAQKQLALPPGVSWPAFDMAARQGTVTTRGAGGGYAVLIAQNAWECYWVRAIRRGDDAAGQRAQTALNVLLANNIFQAPLGAPEGWTPKPLPKVPFVAFAHDGGLNHIRASYRQAAAGDPRNLVQSCRANAPPR